ncbi:hypothetical protein ASG17_01595 [Brevundimonas sp. Leaf363]|nr:hypothetical protein ASG17_01595 [Brevundimonas sp. Leaf363]
MAEAGRRPARRKDVSEPTASEKIDAIIARLGDWRGQTLSGLRALILEADPAIEETCKWAKASNDMMGTPVWERAGIITTGETYKTYVKLTFAHGAALPDPSGLFNASLGGGMRRAIDVREGEAVDPDAFKALIRAAVARNLEARAAKAR